MTITDDNENAGHKIVEGIYRPDAHQCADKIIGVAYAVGVEGFWFEPGDKAPEA